MKDGGIIFQVPRTTEKDEEFRRHMAYLHEQMMSAIRIPVASWPKEKQ